PEIFGIDAGEAREITRIVEPDADAHDILEAVAGFIEDGGHVVDRLAAFGDDAAGDDLTLFHRYLAGDIEPSGSFGGAGKGQRLTAGAGLAGAVAFDCHGVSLSCLILAYLILV